MGGIAPPKPPKPLEEDHNQKIKGTGAWAPPKPPKPPTVIKTVC